MNGHPALPHRLRLLPLLLLAAACGDGEAGRERVVVTDSAGIRIVESSAPAWEAGEEWRLASSPSLTIGMAEGAEEYLFDRVTSAVRRADGGVVVADGRSAVIRLYDAGGRHLRTIGGRGGGPGEFQFLMAVALLHGDSIAAYDLSNGRVSVFDAEGEFVRAVTVSRGENGGRPIVIGIFPDGSMLSRIPELGGADVIEDGLQRRPEIFARYARDGTLLDTIATQPGSDEYSQTSTRDGEVVGISMWVPHFGRAQIGALVGDYAVLGSNDRYELQLHGPDGTLERLIRRRVDVLPVTDALIAASVNELLAAAPNEAARNRRAESLRSLPHLPTVPFYERVLGDDAGNLWVEEYAVPGEEAPGWAVYDPEGRLLGNVQMPADFRPLHMGADFVLGVASDDLEVQRVQIYPLEKAK